MRRVGLADANCRLNFGDFLAESLSCESRDVCKFGGVVRAEMRARIEPWSDHAT